MLQVLITAFLVSTRCVSGDKAKRAAIPIRGPAATQQNLAFRAFADYQVKSLGEPILPCVLSVWVNLMLQGNRLKRRRLDPRLLINRNHLSHSQRRFSVCQGVKREQQRQGEE